MSSCQEPRQQSHRAKSLQPKALLYHGPCFTTALAPYLSSADVPGV